MMRKILAAVVAVAVAFAPVFAAAQVDGALGKSAYVATQALAANKTDNLRQVCTGTRMDNGIRAAGNQILGRAVLYCPNGFQSLYLGRGGTYQNNTVETDKLAAEPTNAAVEVNIPALWDKTVTYTAGQSVQWFSSAGNPFWTAVNTSTNSPPGAGNSDWTGGAVPTLAVETLNGKRNVGMVTTTTAAGSTIQNGLTIYDATPAQCASACFIAVRFWIATTASNQSGYSFLGYPLTMSNGFSAAGSQSDVTLSSNMGNGTYTFSGSVRPVIAIGLPNPNTKPSVCILGDSRASNTISGQGIQATISITNGGSGYTSADVGKEVNIGTAGASAGAVDVPARVIITTVSGGAVTGLKASFTGSYTNVTNQPSQTMANASQTISNTTPQATVGSGAIATFTLGGSGYDTGDQYGAINPLERALTELGYPVANFAQPSDTLGGWITQAYARLAYVHASGCQDALIEYGINDLNAGTTAATLEAEFVTVLGQLKAQGVKKVYLVTPYPFVVSTDGFVTTGNQSAANSTNETQRQALATWERTTALTLGFSGTLDWAKELETAANSGIFKVTGAVCPLTCDGLHLGWSGVVSNTAVMKADIPKLGL